MMTTIARGDGSRILEPRRMVVRDADAWRALWALHAGPDAAPPEVDFATRVVAAVFAGERPSPGFTIAIADARPDGDGLSVSVEEGVPAPGRTAAQLIVTPFHVVTVPRVGGDVRFVDAGVRGAAPVPRDAPSSTGLTPNVAAALAYLAGPFSGLLFLLVERTSRYVRFHAWQSVLGLGSLGLLSALLLVSAFAALLISPSLFTVMYWTAFLAGLAWLILWAACVAQALRGRPWKLPLIGSAAEARAARAG